MKTRLLLLTLAGLLAAGCSASSDDDAEAAQGAASNGGPASSGVLDGTLKVVLDGRTVTFDYALSNTDLTARTTVWNAKITDRGGNAKATDDVNVAGRITAVDRCPGCFTAEIPGGRSGPLAVVKVSDGEVASITYEGVDAKLVDTSTATGKPPTAAGSPNDTGACTLNGGTCKPTKRSECQVGTLFPAQRGAMVFSFDAGGSCKP